MPTPDPFAALGLPSSATRDDVQRAFRALLAAHHPDHGGRGIDAAALRRIRDAALAQVNETSRPAAPAAPAPDPGGDHQVADDDLSTDTEVQAARARTVGARRAATGASDEHLMKPRRCADRRMPASGL